jgi:hypothetical protein
VPEVHADEQDGDRRKAREDELAKQNGFEGDKESRKSSEFYEIKKNDKKYQTSSHVAVEAQLRQEVLDQRHVEGRRTSASSSSPTRRRWRS